MHHFINIFMFMFAYCLLFTNTIELCEGMAHRGRINILHNFLQKPFSSICNQFNESEFSSGDIKFHLGARAELTLPDIESTTTPVSPFLEESEDGEVIKKRTMHVSLCANPSHLEAVYPVVIGKTKAKQFYINDTQSERVMPLILHGDAAFCGQGIVPETMELSNLPDYSVGGAVHIIINNQIGFTTEPKLARSSYHCSNIAKVIEVPVFHVNGDDVDAVVAVCKLAVQYRQHFHKDCVIDLVCYRRHGHTNMEDPKITQPLTYKVIDTHPSTLELYGQKLVANNIITDNDIQEKSEALMASFQEDFVLAKEYVPDPTEWLSSNW
jgi:2-oxoglutarate dehydrogenase E1 component